MTPSLIPNEILSLAYGAASNSTLWGEFCDALNLHTGVPVGLIGHDVVSTGCDGFIASGWDPAGLDHYESYYGHGDLNPWMDGNMSIPLGQVGSTDQVVPRAELMKTEFYNDWLRHQEGAIASAAAMCYRNAHKFVLMVATSTTNNVDVTLDKNIELFQQLTPHLMRSIEIAQTLSGGTSISKPHLDASRHAVILIRRSGKIDYVNQKATDLLANSRLFRVDARDKLSSSNTKISSFLEQTIMAVQVQGFSDLPAPCRVQTAGFHTRILHPHIFPVDAEIDFPASAWFDPIAGGIVISDQLGLRVDNHIGRIVEAFGATPAETSLARALLCGKSVQDHAEHRRISSFTARNQMQSLLQKTSTHSQAEFVQRMMTLSSPFDEFYG